MKTLTDFLMLLLAGIISIIVTIVHGIVSIFESFFGLF